VRLSSQASAASLVKIAGALSGPISICSTTTSLSPGAPEKLTPCIRAPIRTEAAPLQPTIRASYPKSQLPLIPARLVPGLSGLRSKSRHDPGRASRRRAAQYAAARVMMARLLAFG
jgi:hypothetical protein